MNTQVLTFRPQKPIFISTPLGLITLERCEEDKRKVKLTLPLDYKAFIGNKPQMRKGEMVKETPDGLQPKFPMLVPIVNNRGLIVGVEIPRSFTLEESEKDNGQHSRAEAVADSEGSNHD